MSIVPAPVWFILRRLGTSVLTLVGLVTVVFVMTKLIPGDEARAAAGEGATPAQVERMRQQLGLDQPVIVQYLDYLERLMRGSLGTSIATHHSIASDIGGVLPPSAQLAVLALLIALATSVPAATLAAARSGSGSDSTSRFMVIALGGLPAFWLALVLQWLIGTNLRILPISGAASVSVTVPRVTGMTVVDAVLAGNPYAVGDALAHLILPAAVLALPVGTQFFRVLRAELVVVLEREHILVARAKGVPGSRIVVRHALPNASGSLLTMLGIQIGFLIASAVVVESIFALPGIGSYLFNAVQQKDINAVLGSVITIGAVVIAANFLIDMAQLVRDPRIRSAQMGG